MAFPPISLAEFRADLRAALLDLVSPYQWPDAALDSCLQAACARYGFEYPQQARFVLDLDPGVTGITLTANGNGEIVRVLRVELPAGTPVPEDGRQTSDPAGTGSTQYRQGWWYLNNFLYLRNIVPAAIQITIELLQTYNVPDGTFDWNGPAQDRRLIGAFARREAYALLLEWRQRDGGDAGALLGLLAESDRALAALLTSRRRQGFGSRPLDI